MNLEEKLAVDIRAFENAEQWILLYPLNREECGLNKFTYELPSPTLANGMQVLWKLDL